MLLPIVQIRLTQHLSLTSPQDRVKWGSQPSAVGLPFDWHLPAMRRDSQGPLKATPMHPLAHFQPSMESPYAVLGAPSLQRTSVYSITDDCWCGTAHFFLSDVPQNQQLLRNCRPGMRRSSGIALKHIGKRCWPWCEWLLRPKKQDAVVLWQAAKAVIRRR